MQQTEDDANVVCNATVHTNMYTERNNTQKQIRVSLQYFEVLRKTMGIFSEHSPSISHAGYAARKVLFCWFSASNDPEAYFCVWNILQLPNPGKV
jgi:hypothetical protein